MNIQTIITLSLKETLGSYDNFHEQFKAFVNLSKKQGLKAEDIKNRLSLDLKNREGIFKDLFSTLERERAGLYNKTAEISSNQFVENKDLKYEWVLDPDVKEHCEDCLERESMGSKTYKQWERMGLPATGHTLCTDYCRCTLIPI